MPRIAGQQREYFANQLKSFVSRNRENDIAILMYKVHNVSPALGSALAAHLSGSIPGLSGALQRGSLSGAEEFTKRESPKTTFPLVRRVMARTRMAMGKTPGSQASFIPMWSKSYRIGLMSARKSLLGDRSRHDPDRGRLDQRSNQGRRSLSQRAAVNPGVTTPIKSGNSDHETQ